MATDGQVVPEDEAVSLRFMQIDSFRKSVEWFGEELNQDPVHMVMGLNGEIGEVTQIFHKMKRGSLNLQPEDLQQEIAWELSDVLIYTMLLATVFDIDLQAAYEQKQEYNSGRFG
jgi:NTP pyrophosphatase (non-canonical NTP hydrolase)